MQSYISRSITSKIRGKLDNNPAVVLYGPRQCGKSTLVKELIRNRKSSFYLDLEKPSDAVKLSDPEAFFSIHNEGLYCLDEVQRVPNLFPTLRSIIDERGTNGQFLFLGSASPDLLKQSAESLAGRISYMELTPFFIKEIEKTEGNNSVKDLWLKGGYPRSLLAKDLSLSFEWRQDFIRTFIERDLPLLGFNPSMKNFERFMGMSAHNHAQLLNASKLGASLGVSYHTIKAWTDIMEQTFWFRVLPPYEINLKKRLVKSPKIYFRDSGLLHCLLNIRTHDDLLGHPVYGSSWEGFVIENVCAACGDYNPFFFRTQTGVEIDLVLVKGSRKIAIECKASTAPEVTSGLMTGMEDLEIEEAMIIAPVKESYPLKKNIRVVPLSKAIDELKNRH